MKLTSKLLLATLFIPGLASAHTGVGQATGFMHGFQHPFSGVDHLLAMLAVGILAAQSGHKMHWKIPGAFLISLVIGGSIGFSSDAISMSFIEQGILASVVVSGALIAIKYSLSSLQSASIVSLFALFHGYAHGAEMPADISALSYTFGFALAATLIVAVGFSVSEMLQKKKQYSWTRIVGSVIGLSGIYLTFA